MTDKIKYKEHVKKGWCFAQETANELTNEKILQAKLAIMIFEKTCSPLHYFLQNQQELPLQPPTINQVKFAKDLGIVDPEKFSKEELSKKIDEALKKKKELG